MAITAQARRVMDRPRPVDGESARRHIRLAEDLPAPHGSSQPVLLRAFHPDPPSVEELQLVQKIFFLSSGEMPRVIVFSGVEEQDASETVCARTAEVLSCLVNESICLMDADVRDPRLHLRYDIDGSAHRGVSGAGGSSDEDPVRSANLWVLPASALRECHAGFAPTQIRGRLEAMRAQFGFVLICAPPLSTAAEGILLGQLADGIVLTVMARSTRREAALKVRRNLDLYNVRLLGAVMNEREGKTRKQSMA